MTHTPPTPGFPWDRAIVAWDRVIVVFLLLHAIGSLADRRAATDRIEQLEHHSRDLTSQLDQLRGRVLRLERPDEPVHPPRHPGRIGGKPVIPWIEPWSGSRPTLGTEIGSADDRK